ncbi:B12-binding domain-containing radical SAM protein [Streptomyces arenae]|uniref:B12-binding domain-containing radical SAM protein n=1 Tax=Streptomyces arenae TaxID=29301 RepID=UPI00265984C1|nr:radical SAM protein [Streptomyces arenae]MCG7202349.1 radical SAM protein [Streptomyces arenae]
MTAIDLGMPLAAAASPRVPEKRPAFKLRVWLCDLTYTQQAVSAETMPQAVAGLATHVGTVMDVQHTPRIFKFPEDLATALENEGAPDVIGFSHYIWNAHVSIAFARVIKEQCPRTVVVMGGPHYPILRADQVTFWHQRLAGATDFYIDGEGEIAFADLLLHLNSKPAATVRDTIPGVHSLTADRREVFTPRPRKRIHDLAEVPSPYLAGLLDTFFERGGVPTITTTRGCPFACDFCTEGQGYFSKVAKRPRDEVEAELHYIGAKMAPLVRAGTSRNELLITDSNFGMFPEDKHTCQVIAECQKRYGWPRVVNVTTGKNQRERVLDAVAQVPGTISLSGSVQSLDPNVLAAVHRKNISTEKMMEIALQSAQAGTPSYSEVILALPNDSKKKHFDSLRGLMAARFDRLNMFQLTLLPSSEMYARAYREKWGLGTKWRVMPRCFGKYTVLGKEVRTAELDEVCVELPNLSYDEYRECRVMDLLVSSLYNGGVFGTIVAVLRAHRIEPMTWLEECLSQWHGPQMETVLDDFLWETDEQLWDNREDLMRYAAANVDRYISGDLGNNLLYTYRMRMISEALEDLADVAERAALAVLRRAGVAKGGASLVARVVREGAAYHRLKLSQVFMADPPAELSQVAAFDIDLLLDDARAGAESPDMRRYRLSARIDRHFVLTDRQRSTLRTYVGQMGATAAGIGWLLTKVRMPDIVREVRTSAGYGSSDAEPSRSDAVTP